MSWTCPRCEREIGFEGQWHNCVKVSLSSLFEGKAPELELVFDKLLAVVATWEDVKVSTTQHCIVFVHRQTFLIICPMKKQLDLKFYTAIPLESPQVLKSSFYSGRYENHIRVTQVEDLAAEIFVVLRKSYDLL